MKNKEENKYDGTSIQVLEGLSGIRKRPGMYIGNVDSKGLHHLVWEIVDNSIDEVLAGYASEINITLNDDGSISIDDNGRGIPIDLHSKTGISTLETVFTILHAGGKFGGKNSGYKVSGGLHGVGATVVNALSSWLIINVYNGESEYYLKFSFDNETNKEFSSGLKKIGQTKKRGTSVTFLPNFKLFNKGVNSLDFEIIKTRVKETAYLNKGLRINLTNNENSDEIEKVTYCFDGGIVDFVKDLNRSQEAINNDVIYSEGKSNDIIVEVALQYIKAYQSRINSYVNNIATVEGGTHEQGFFDAILRTINSHSAKFIPAKEHRVFKRDDIKEGMVAIISIKHPDPMYEGQTKGKLGNIEVRKIVNNIISTKFEEYLLENPTQTSQIITKILQASKAREASEKAREMTRRKNVLGFSTLPGKLADCSSTNMMETELFIVEGDSAGGSAKMGRDREIQAILPLRGKVINSERTRIDKLFNNNEITSMITAFGTGVREEFDLNKLRYGKIIIMTDADVDGSHIRTLLLTFFYRFYKELIEKGHIYIACPPLYKIYKGKQEQYCYTDTEKEEFFKNFSEEEVSKFNIQRYKGLGEMNDDQLWETTMNPENRKLLKVTIDDTIRADKVFTELMGELVEPRREFITKNSKFANLDY